MQQRAESWGEARRGQPHTFQINTQLHTFMLLPTGTQPSERLFVITFRLVMLLTPWEFMLLGNAYSFLKTDTLLQLV